MKIKFLISEAMSFLSGDINSGKHLISSFSLLLSLSLFSFDSFAQSGCTDSNACNFDALATVDDGTCEDYGWFIPYEPGTDLPL